MKTIRHLLTLLLCGAAAPGAALAADAASGFTSVDTAAARQLVAPAGHRAPTILALWSAECVHCKKNLALFAAMTKADPGLRLVTLAVEPAEPQLGAILDRFGVPGARFAYGDDAPERLAFAIDPDWRGELPRTLFFDGRGGVKAVSGVVDEARTRALLGLGALTACSAARPGTLPPTGACPLHPTQ
jgi:hypothetical protein